jgi:hypothetical protein
MAFSDNNGSNPTAYTAHPQAEGGGYAAAAGVVSALPIEIDIPLNSSGQLYMFTLAILNCTVGSSYIYLSVVGWWDGL